jgi:DNA-binding ferritin-like protein
MTKSLTESAAEILKASLASAGKEPTKKLPGAEDDLGGATETQPDGGDVGGKAAAGVKQAAAPKGPEVAAEPTKKLAKEESETSDEEVVAEEAAEEVAEISEEELAEAKKKMKMDMVAKHKGSMAEDVNALFNGESLSEEFRTKATTIFEAAVQSRVEKIVEDIINDNDAVLEEAVEGIKVELAEQVDEYLNYVVEQWIKDNEVAIESGLRAELSEDFINGLKNLFAEHYIDLPEEKLEVAESLAEKVVELEEAAAASAEKLSALSKELNEAKKNEAIRKICEGLTEVQVGKMKSLAEGVEFTTEGEFNNKLAVIRENYFPNKKVVSEVTAAAETSEAQPEVEVPSYMSNYVKAISKTLPK